MKAYQILKPRITKELVLDKQKMMNPPQGWITIRVSASGICGTDLHIFLGEYLGDYPIIPGHEFSGDVVAIGDKVDKFQIGDRVAIEPNLSCGICDACLHNRQHFCENWQAIGVTMPGGWQHMLWSHSRLRLLLGIYHLKKLHLWSLYPV